MNYGAEAPHFISTRLRGAKAPLFRGTFRACKTLFDSYRHATALSKRCEVVDRYYGFGSASAFFLARERT